MAASVQTGPEAGRHDAGPASPEGTRYLLRREPKPPHTRTHLSRGPAKGPGIFSEASA
jgi:hypothetical protein